MVLAFNLAGDGLRDVLDPHNIEGGARWDQRRSHPGAVLGDPPGGPEEIVADSPGHRLVRAVTDSRKQ